MIHQRNDKTCKLLGLQIRTTTNSFKGGNIYAYFITTKNIFKFKNTRKDRNKDLCFSVNFAIYDHNLIKSCQLYAP